LFHLLQNLFPGRTQGRAAGTSRPTRRALVSIEALEDRSVPAAISLAPYNQVVQHIPVLSPALAGSPLHTAPTPAPPEFTPGSLPQGYGVYANGILQGTLRPSSDPNSATGQFAGSFDDALGGPGASISGTVWSNGILTNTYSFSFAGSGDEQLAFGGSVHEEVSFSGTATVSSPGVLSVNGQLIIQVHIVTAYNTVVDGESSYPASFQAVIQPMIG
jgi:hypothetical protein